MAAILLVCLLVTLVAFIGWLLGSIPPDTGLGLFLIDIFLAWLLWKSLQKQTTIGSYVLPLLFFAAGISGNLIGGMQAPAMVLYALAITIAAILHGTKTLIAFLTLSLISFTAIAIAQYTGALIPARSWETAFTNRLVIFISAMIGIAFSVRLLKIQYEKVILEIANREEQYRLLLQYAPVGIYEVDLVRQRFISVNDAMCEHSGYSREEFLKLNPQDIMTEQSRAQFLNRMSKYISGENLQETARFEIRKKNGELIWILLNVRFITENGIPKGAHVVAHNITAIKEAEDKLSASEKKYRLIAENTADQISIMDMNLRFTYISPAIMRLRGLTVEEAMEQSLDKVLTPKSLRLGLAVFEEEMQLEASGKADPDRTRILELEEYKKDGSTISVEVNFSFLRTKDGKPVGIIMVSRDITERKIDDEALREQENKLSSIFRAAPVGIGMVINRVFQEVNDTLCRMTGHSREELLGHSARILYPTDEDYEYVGQEKYRQISVNRIGTVETRWKKKDGTVIDIILSSTPLDPDDLSKGVTFTALDITTRKQVEREKKILQERLQQADKMESIGTLAGGIAHDFNNLLMGIQGYASMALMNIEPSNTNYERLKRIEQQMQSGADLTKQLLGFARGGRYEVKPTDMNEILEKTSSMFGRTKKEISLHRKPEKDLWSVEVDRGQMEQVFMNIYVNAWQAMPGGGNIYLETDNVLLNDEQTFPYAVKPGKYVKINITDTGTGMDEKTKERIFDPFFTTKGMGRGTGLGLATVYGIIKGHHGMINVYSEPGHGTTFTIYLPASDKKISKENKPIEEIVTGTETILLVDDEKMVLEVNKELLESMGYKVHAAGSGQEAVAIYMEKKDKIDLVILDMIMPGISGSDTFNRLREINQKVKVLLSSGYSLNGEAQTIMDRGCNGFLQKPFKLEELSGKIREMLG